MKVLHILMKLNKSFIALLLDTKALFPEKPYPTNPLIPGKVDELIESGKIIDYSN